MKRIDVKVNRVLNYPGSKWKIAKNIVNLIPEHHSYVEPYFGSGAVLFNKTPSNIETINDMDDDVVNLFRCIQQDPERLSYLVDTTPYARSVYEKAFEENVSDEYAKAICFLIKCWQGHGFRTAGNKVGWKLDIQGRESAYALRNWNKLPNSILSISERLKNIQIEHRPALDVIERYNFENVFMYLDPPYVTGTRKAKCDQYKHEMTDEDHIDLLNMIVASKAKIMISGYKSELYNDILKDWRVIEMNSNDQSGNVTKEVLWMNYDAEQQIRLF